MPTRKKKSLLPAAAPAPELPPPRKRVLLFGESPLVEEYAVLCVARGYEVQVRWNPEPASRSKRNSASAARRSSLQLPAGVKKVQKPPKTADIALELTNTAPEIKKKNIVELDAALGAGTVILSSSLTVTAADQTKWMKLKSRLIGLGALPSFLAADLVEIAATNAAAPASLRAAKDFITSLGKEPVIVRDTIGMVLPRIVCALANEACFALAEGIASKTDIDTAMKLGTNYPQGPVEWAERVGLRQVYAVMPALSRQIDRDRYRIAPVLERAAQASAASLPATGH